MNETWKPSGTQSFGHSMCQLCPCLCLQSPVLNPKDKQVLVMLCVGCSEAMGHQK